MTSTAPLAGYLRVSAGAAERTEAGTLHSPDWQRSKIEHLGRQVIFHEPELDVTGSKAKRPILDKILAGIEDGTYSGLAVANLDRLSRLSPRDRIDLFERIEAAGGVVVSASENLDPSTPEGRFARDVFLGVARMQWERYRDNYQRAKQHAHDNGMRLGPTPLGYTRTPEGKLAIDKTEAELVRALFHVCATEGLAATVRHYRAHAPAHTTGKRAGKQRNVNHARTRAIITNRVYLGEQHFAGFPSILDAHPPIIKPHEYDAAQAALKPIGHRSTSAEFPLSGLVFCGTCGNHMSGARGYDNRRCYRCVAGVSNFKGERCPRPVVVVAQNLEDHLRQLLADGVGNVELEQIDNTDYDAIAAVADEAEAEYKAYRIHERANAPGYAEGLAIRERAWLDAQARKVEVASELARQGQILAAPEAILGSDGPTLRSHVTDTGIRPIILPSGRGSGHRLSLADRVVFDDPSATMPAAQVTAQSGK